MKSSRERLRLALLRSLGGLLPMASAGLLRQDARVLIIRPDHIGDVLLTTPAITLIREALPSAYVAALVGPWGAEAMRRGPTVDNLSTLEFPGFTRRPARWMGEPYVRLLRALELRRQRFDVAVVMRADHWWGAMLAALAGIPNRVGFKVPECQPFLTDALEAPEGAHWSELSLLLARRVCERAGVPVPDVDARPVFSLTESEREAARSAMCQNGASGDGPTVALHPGAGAELKLWSSGRWAQTLDLLQERAKARTLIVSSSAEQPLVTEIQAAARFSHPHILTDAGLGFLGAVLEQADVVLGSDSGPLHIAAAVGTPTVRLYGPTAPSLFGPWPPNERHVVLRSLVPCSPCGHFDDPPCGATKDPACLLEQSPETVADAASWLLSHRLMVSAR